MPRIYQSKKGQCFVTVPKAIARAKGWKGGDEVEWIIDNLGQLILRPKLQVV